jgi:hypothetical protein
MSTTPHNLPFKPFTDFNPWGLLDKEKAFFGDRCPKGFTKLSLLGKGGIACVWLCETDQQLKVAVKQFPKKNRQTDPSA